MRKKFFTTASVMGALAVFLGAFGVHILKKLLPPETITIFETGVRYQFYHCFAILFVGLLYQKFHIKQFVWAGHCFIIGVIFFSGSLYAIALSRIGKTESMAALNAITPLGGLFFMAGWILMLVGVQKAKY